MKRGDISLRWEGGVLKMGRRDGLRKEGKE
jgi:hypothetical protein